MSPRILVWFWSGGGGGSQFAVHLAYRLAVQFGHDAVTLSLRADDPSAASAEQCGLSVLRAHVVSDRRRPLASLSGLVTSAKVLASHARDADIVIAAMNFAALAPLSLTLKKPLVYCAHDPEPHPGDYETAAQSATQALLLGRAARVVALSDYSARLLAKRRGVSGKLHTAPLSSVFAPKPHSPARSGPTRLLFAGRMIAYKGLDLLADSLDRVAHRGDWRLVIAGHGPALTDAARARFKHKQIESLHGAWLSEAAIDQLMTESDVLIAPYRAASQSGVVAQALAWGKPCVVTPVGALAEQIDQGKAGWIASHCTPEALTTALTEMLDNPAARAMKAAGAHKVARTAWDGDHWGWLERDGLANGRL